MKFAHITNIYVGLEQRQVKGKWLKICKNLVALLMILFIVKDVPDIFTSNAYSSVKPELNKIKDKLNNAI